MKKLLFLLLFPLLLLGQNPTAFPYGIKLTNPTSVTATKVNVQESDGKVNTMPMNSFFASHAAQSDTGVLSFAGLTTNSSTTINIGAAYGYVVNNETNPTTPVSTLVNYAGASNVTVTTVGTGIASYVMLSSAGVISFQNTFPTSAERKAKIWLGKVSHPAGSITLVVNEPDYITSPQALTRDLMQVLGYQNDGVYPYANGANLNINITSGNIHGNGINFVNDRTTPNEIHMGPATVQAFTYRSQTGVGGAVTAVTPGFYDVGGVVTAIPGSSNQATIQYFYAVPGIGYVAQLGQTLYSTFGAAVQALGNRTDVFTVYTSFIGNTIPIAALVVTKGCTALNDTGVTAQFFNANKNGDFYGATAGTSTATLQSTYNNSLVPQITTSTVLGAVTVKRGSAADTDDIIVGQNGAGTNTFSATGNGVVSGTGFIDSNSTATDALLAGGTTLSNPVSGFGTINVIPKFSGTTTQLAGSNIYDNGTNVGIGTSNPTFGKLQIGGLGIASSDDLLVLNKTSGFGRTTFNQTYDNTYYTNGKNLNISLDTTKMLTLAINNTGSDSRIIFPTGRMTVSGTSDNGVDELQVNGSISATSITTTVNTIKITTAVSITTATLGTNSLTQDNRHVIIDNGVNPINITCNNVTTTSYGKTGTGAITFVQGAGRTLVQLSGTAVLNGAVGSTATLWSDGTTDYLAITNY